MSQLQFKIVDSGGNRILVKDGERRPATQEEIELWDLINPNPECSSLWEALSTQMSKLDPSFILAWWIFYRLGDALPADVDPGWFRRVILEYQDEPQALTVARLKQEFPGDFREGGR